MLLNLQSSRPFLNFVSSIYLVRLPCSVHCLGTDIKKWPVDIDALKLIARCADQGGRGNARRICDGIGRRSESSCVHQH